MSIDLDWGKLDTSLSCSLVDLLNKQLATTERPSFIGPVEVISLEFGTTSPDVELVDLRDIYRDFLEDDDDNDSGEPVKVEGAEDEEGFEWVSRRAAGRLMAQEQQPQYHHLPPHVRYGSGPVTDMFASVPALRSPRQSWNGSMSVPSLVDFRPPTFAGSLHRSSPPRRPLTPLSPQQQSVDTGEPLDSHSQTKESESSPSNSQQQDAQPNGHPNLQLHLHVTWRSDLRITLTTSLLINYPSPMFMSLPIKLSVTGLVFTGELAVAYEGERRRIHLCILDDLDPFGPAGDRPKRDSASSTPPELDDDLGIPGIHLSRSTKPLPIGQRLLPNIYIESEIGQADKHVLKNVMRVEKFIQDVIRKTVEEELVFPNFHTLLMGEQ
jgi:mitochondrial distribution and morphology protein 12